MYFDDTSLREFVFLDPPWLCTFLCVSLISGGINVKNGLLNLKKRRSNVALKELTHYTPYESSLIELQQMYSTLKFALRQFGAVSQLTFGGDVAAALAIKFRFFQTCFLNLLSKFELSLPCMNKMLLLPSLLPDEYLLRADYPGAKVKVSTNFIY